MLSAELSIETVLLPYPSIPSEESPEHTEVTLPINVRTDILYQASLFVGKGVETL
jgi:hypothetical protein